MSCLKVSSATYFTPQDKGHLLASTLMDEQRLQILQVSILPTCNSTILFWYIFEAINNYNKKPPQSLEINFFSLVVATGRFCVTRS
tara:strand:- start:182 stop:439 length:258 start_codon:yes stop_codon:yes gene_type:complete